ncbi:MAG: biosynthetic-type acetolactate synthase large subunit [Lachnospiraceae bacterium]|nr:biosynthetic-type acetolactate synthase large subunit [Lachnospiraceae bacterium]
MNGAQAMVKCLEAEGVERLYGYSGAAICPFYDALLSSKITPVLVRQEQNAAHMASGYARMKGRAGVCVVTSGPGATNLITGIATAFADSIPLVCITGQVVSSMIGSDVFQEADITGAVESFVKYSYLVRDAQDLPRIMKEAFYIAESGRRGPVLIDVPTDVMACEIKKYVYPDKVQMRTYKPTVEGNGAQIAKVIRELEKAERPIMCVGGGVALSGAIDEIRAFVRKYQIPVVSTMMGIGAMPSGDNLYFGMVGNNGRPYANRAVGESDLLLVVGARVADRAVNRPDLITENKVLIHIDVDPAEIGKNVGPTIPLVGDIRHVFRQIDKSEIHMKDHAAWINTLCEYRLRTQEVRAKAGKAYVDVRAFLETLSLRMDKNAVFVCDVGQNQIWSTHYFKVSEKGRFMTSGGMGTMGYAIPAAFGASQARPDRQTIALCGDGGFQMSMCELGTIAQYGGDIGIVILRNNTLGMVMETIHSLYDSRATMVDLGKDTPDYKKIAEAYGMGYEMLDGKGDMEQALYSFLHADGARILEVSVDPRDRV